MPVAVHRLPMTAACPALNWGLPGGGAHGEHDAREDHDHAADEEQGPEEEVRLVLHLHPAGHGLPSVGIVERHISSMWAVMWFRLPESEGKDLRSMDLVVKGCPRVGGAYKASNCVTILDVDGQGESGGENGRCSLDLVAARGYCEGRYDEVQLRVTR